MTRVYMDFPHIKMANDTDDDDDVEILLKMLDAYERGEIVEQVVINWADRALVDEAGQCVWTAIAILEEKGYAVFPGETDRFGWLTGCIQTKRGVIVYG